MSAQEAQLAGVRDAAALVLAAEVDDGESMGVVIAHLDFDERAAMIDHLVTVCGLALQGTGGREPVDWLTRLIEDLRRRSLDV